MATDFTKWVPLKQVVAYVLDETNLGVGSFDKLWVMAFRGLVDMHYEISAEPKSFRFPVLPNKTVTLPPDYLGWTKIGILNSKGEVASLRINNTLSTLKDSSPNRLDYLTADVNNSVDNNGAVFLNYFQNGSYANEYYGIHGGLQQFGECKVDEKNNVILFPPDFRYDHIILEYISSPQKDGDYQIPIADQEALIAFIMWKLKQVPRQEYTNALKIARRRKPGKKVSWQEVNQVFRESNGMKLRE